MIVKRTDLVADGVGKLIDEFRSKPIAVGILTAWLKQIQGFEDVLWEVLDSRTIAGVGAQLDSLGALVGVAREGRTDVEYRVRILLRVRINRSQGRAEDILAIMAGMGAGTYVYTEYQPARFRIYSFATAEFDRPLVEAIRLVKPAGVAFDFLGNSEGLLEHVIRYDHTTPFITSYENGGFAHTTGLVDNHPTSVATY